MLAVALCVAFFTTDAFCQDAAVASVYRPLFSTSSPTSGGCRTLPTGSMISLGFCRRYYNVCLRGRAQIVDCYSAAQSAYPGLSLDPNGWAFDIESQVCVPLSKCIRGSDPASHPPLSTRPTERPSPTTTQAPCVPGLRVPSAPCSRVFLRCTSEGVFEPRLCPSNSLFDTKFRICLYHVPECRKQPSQITSTVSSVRSLGDQLQKDADSEGDLTAPTPAECVERQPTSKRPSRFYRVAEAHRSPPRSYGGPWTWPQYYYYNRGDDANDFDDFRPYRYGSRSDRSMDAFNPDTFF